MADNDTQTFTPAIDPNITEPADKPHDDAAPSDVSPADASQGAAPTDGGPAAAPAIDASGAEGAGAKGEAGDRAGDVAGDGATPKPVDADAAPAAATHVPDAQPTDAAPPADAVTTDPTAPAGDTSIGSADLPDHSTGDVFNPALPVDMAPAQDAPLAEEPAKDVAEAPTATPGESDQPAAPTQPDAPAPAAPADAPVLKAPPASADSPKTDSAPEADAGGLGGAVAGAPDAANAPEPAAKDNNASIVAPGAAIPGTQTGDSLVPEQHPVPSDGLMVDPSTGKPLPDEEQAHGANNPVPEEPKGEPAAPMEHPKPSDGPMVDPQSGKPLPDHLQVNGGQAVDAPKGDAPSSDAAPAPADDGKGLAQDRANGYDDNLDLKHELEVMLKNIKGALQHEADLGRQLIHKVEHKIHKLLDALKQDI